MPPSEEMLLAARNGFLGLFVVLFGLSVYQFINGEGFLAGGLWTLGAVVFYASKFYYNRQDLGDTEPGTEDRPS
jgi:hypothetical protein